MSAAGDPRAVEILCVGTELLLGNILNSNARFFSDDALGSVLVESS